MDTNNTQPMVLCPPSADTAFGPTVAEHCRGGFDFTLLFEQSVLSLAPSLLLLVCALVRISSLFRATAKVVPSHSHRVKLGAILLYGCVQLAVLVLWSLPSPIPKTTASVASASFSLLNTLIISLLSHFEHTRSIRPSTVLNTYLFFSLLFDATQVRTLWLLGGSHATATMLTVAILVKTVIAWLEAQGKGSLLSPSYRNVSPEALSGVYSRSVFWWLNHLLKSGWQKVLSFKDLYALPKELESEDLGKKLGEAWKKGKGDKSPRHAMLFTTLTTLKWALLGPVPARVCLIGFNYSQPFLVTRVINFVDGPKAPGSKNIGYGLIGATALIYFGLAVATGYYNYKISRAMTMIRGSLVSVIYGKTLDLNSNVEHGSAALTLMSTDVDRIVRSMDKMHEIWASSIETCIAIYLLERQLGWACVAPLVVALISFLGNSWIARIIPRRQKQWLLAGQKRVAMTSSMLNNMKCVKMMGLSDELQSDLQGQRVREVEFSKKFRSLSAWNVAVANLPVQVSAPAAFLLFVFTSQYNRSTGITPAQSFTALSIIQLLTNPLAGLLSAIPSFTSSLNCFQRIQAYLLSNGREDDRLLDIGPTNGSQVESHPPFENGFAEPIKHASEVQNCGSFQSDIELQGIRGVTVGVTGMRDSNSSIISIDKASFAHSRNSSFSVHDVDLELQRGIHLFICGPIGSGKTTLLKGLLGELVVTKGFLRMRTADAAFCQQTPWLPNATIREIVVGESPFDRSWFDTVLACCAFDEDVRNFLDKEDSVIGSRGISLSGGQKQRLALARCVYARKSLVILDDVFSALDSRTEELVFERLFSSRGLFQQHNTTVILATHAVQHLRSADYILALGKNGIVLEQGTFEDLNAGNGYVRHLIIEEKTKKEVSDDEPARTLERPEAQTRLVDLDLMRDDKTRQIGETAVYKYYYRSVGWKRMVPWVVIGVMGIFCEKFPVIWLQFWTEAAGADTALYLGIYFLLGLSATGLFTLYLWWILIVMVPKSARKLHWTLLTTVIGAPLSFFTSTDAGITLNRFSQDMYLISIELPVSVLYTKITAMRCLAQVALIAVGAKYFATIIPFCFLATYCLQKFYLRSSRQLRLLDLEAKSPLYTHFTETLEGLPTIRAFGWQEAFARKSTKLLDLSQQPYYLLYCVQRWLNLVLDLMVAVLAIILIAFAVQLRDTTSGATIGVALVNVLGFSQSLSILIDRYTTLETSLGAIARIKGFEETTACEHLPQERESPPGVWPSQGTVEFRDITASYTSDSEPVLRNLTLQLTAGQKVGICGRTGSGKSSLLAALFRLLELKSGEIYVDGLDISTLPRQAIRSRIIAVPQDPFLLDGSIRFNVSPTAPLPDAAIIAALDKVGLWEPIAARGGLDVHIAHAPLSHGQQQLFCLARAMLRTSTILVLDEATSSVDAQTDAKMQTVIRDEFRHHTILTVAHRLNTIMDSDRVAVLEHGRLVELGPPAELLERGGGVFRELWLAQR